MKDKFFTLKRKRKKVYPVVIWQTLLIIEMSREQRGHAQADTSELRVTESYKRIDSCPSLA